MFQSFFRLCDDHESVRIFIEPMEESRSDEISDSRQIFISMVEESHNRWLMNFSDGFGMRKYAFGLVDDKVILLFQDYRNLDIRRFV